MVEQSLRLDAVDQIRAITAASAPHMKKGELRNMLTSLDMDSRDIIEQIGQNDTAKGLTELKQFFSS